MNMTSARRTYVLDTSVLLSEPQALRRFEEHAVVLPLVVLTELEAKRNHPELGWAARTALRSLEELRERHGSLLEELPANEYGGTVRVELNHTNIEPLPEALRSDANDHRILTVANNLKLEGDTVTLVTKDLPLRLKAGVVGLTKTTALETAKEPITANAICPGYVLTPIVEKQIPDTMKEYDMTRDEVIENVMLTRQPSKEFATVEQMGGTATFLCSDAAAQITGTTISVDGGWTAL